MQDDDAVTLLRAPGDGKDSLSLSQVSASGDAERRRAQMTSAVGGGEGGQSKSDAVREVA